jgi:hypothetical protein
LNLSQEHNIELAQARIYIPRNSLYQTAYSHFQLHPDGSKDTYGPHYEILSADIPAKKNFTLTLPLDSVPERLRDQAVAVRIDHRGRMNSEGGRRMGSELHVRSRNYGTYSLAVDTVPPVIYPINIREGKNMQNLTRIYLKASDGLSGIASFSGRINGEWQITTYDAKRAAFYIPLEHAPKGTNHFEFEVKDGVGNINSYTATFIR